MKNTKNILARAVKVGHNDWEVRRGKKTILDDIGVKDVAKTTAEILNRPGRIEVTWNQIFSILVHEYGFTPRDILRAATDDDSYTAVPRDPKDRQRMKETGEMLLADADDHPDEGPVIK